MRLYGYFRSSASYRVRIALNLKGLDVGHCPVPLLDRNTVEVFRGVNPQGLVPALESDGDGMLVQSLAILEYLEERYPTPPLLPKSPADRAYVRSVAQFIACDIHPLNNLRVLRHLKRMGNDQDAIDNWYRHWIAEGFGRLEQFIARTGRSGTCILGDVPGVADCCLVPQMYNARRLDCDLSAYPVLVAIDAHLCALHAFKLAEPSLQPDAT